LHFVTRKLSVSLCVFVRRYYIKFAYRRSRAGTGTNADRFNNSDAVDLNGANAANINNLRLMGSTAVQPAIFQPDHWRSRVV
jgi:hypothetical protein